jgi:hypothetical protein
MPQPKSESEIQDPGRIRVWVEKRSTGRSDTVKGEAATRLGRSGAGARRARRARCAGTGTGLRNKLQTGWGG